MAQNLALATSSDRLRAAASAEEPMHFRQAPHNIDAEQALLGAILVNNEALDRVTGFLDPIHFFDPLHGQIYRDHLEADPSRQAGDADHAADVL